jgi:hypothetical protein
MQTTNDPRVACIRGFLPVIQREALPRQPETLGVIAISVNPR